MPEKLLDVQDDFHLLLSYSPSHVANRITLNSASEAVGFWHNVKYSNYTKILCIVYLLYKMF